MDELNRSRRWCARTMREHASSFYLATRLLPQRKRIAIEAFYGLCRFADDVADEPGFDLEERRRILREIREELRLVDAGRPAGAFPWSYAFLDATRAFEFDVADALLLVEGCERDLEPVDLATFEELEAYSAAVAGTVGRVTMRILGARDADSLERGTRLGIAMQFTNVLRDIDEDTRAGRNYIPRAIPSRRSDRETLETIAWLAHGYYEEARVLSQRVPNDGSRFAILLARNLYEGILTQIERRDFDWKRGRVVVPASRKVTLAARTFLDAYAGFATIR